MTAGRITSDAVIDDELTFVDCADVDDRTLERFYRDVMEPSFRPDELTGLDQLKATYQARPSDSQGILVLRSGEPVAGALGDHFPAGGITLLSYLAVRADLRGRGIGAALLAEVLPRWRAAYEPVAIVAEVEDPSVHPADRYGDPTARLRFYDRTGWRVLPLPYFQPALRPGRSRVRGMLLICFGARGDALPAGRLLGFLDDYVRWYEGEESVLEDAEYLAFRGLVDGWPAGVPIWPMSRAATVRAGAAG